jgi:glycerol-3-phosphate acyltransferase PlsX
MIKIAVDAMGSDHSPKVEVDGALDAAAEYGVPIVLVGHKDKLRPLLAGRDMTGLWKWSTPARP